MVRKRIKDGMRASRVIPGLLVAFLLSACIREGLPECPEQYLTVRYDGTSETDPVEGAVIHLFDREQRYIRTIEVDRRHIEKGIPVGLPVSPGSRPYVSVWGNAGAAEYLNTTSPGTHINEMHLLLAMRDETYSSDPDELFFGIKRLSANGHEEIVIRPKTARIHLTVKGIPEEAADGEYYFTAESAYNGYDLSGIPHRGLSRLRWPGTFTPDGDLITPEVFHLIHYPDNVYEREAGSGSIAVRLWRKDAETDMLAEAEEDETGRPLKPVAGKTMNVLIRLKEDGTIEVNTVFSDWDELHQWDEW